MTLYAPPRAAYGIAEDEYRADPALSQSLAKLLLPPSTPAEFRHAADNPQAPAPQFDLGQAVHGDVLGVGAPLAVYAADAWRTKEAKAFAEDARARGEIPLLTKDADAVKRAADAVRAHPVAGRLLADGDPEVSCWWTDPETGVRCKARLDYVREVASRRVVVDLKMTSQGTHPTALPRTVDRYRYHLQRAWYGEAAAACGLTDPDGLFLFVFVSIVPPHLVTVVELDQAATDAGRRAAARARRTYADCVAAGAWPGHPEDVHLIGLPRWAADLTADQE